jgi:hypothetical protein
MASGNVMPAPAAQGPAIPAVAARTCHFHSRLYVVMRPSAPHLANCELFPEVPRCTAVSQLTSHATRQTGHAVGRIVAFRSPPGPRVILACRKVG